MRHYNINLPSERAAAALQKLQPTTPQRRPPAPGGVLTRELLLLWVTRLLFWSYAQGTLSITRHQRHPPPSSIGTVHHIGLQFLRSLMRATHLLPRSGTRTRQASAYALIHFTSTNATEDIRRAIFHNELL